MNNDALVEEVARRMCCEGNCACPEGCACMTFAPEARYIISIIRPAVIEECAKVAEDEAYGFPSEQLTEHGQGYQRACKEIAAAIRELTTPATQKDTRND